MICYCVIKAKRDIEFWPYLKEHILKNISKSISKIGVIINYDKISNQKLCRVRERVGGTTEIISRDHRSRNGNSREETAQIQQARTTITTITIKGQQSRKEMDTMKTETTRAYINNSFKNVIIAKYGTADLLEHRRPDYYNSGIYGWNWDGYIIDNNTVVITGYRNFPHGTAKTADNDELRSTLKALMSPDAFEVFEECSNI